MLGNIKIYFGKIIDVSDEEKICRCRVSIDGLTNEIVKDELPWYFPWYGLNYLPIIDDVVSVIVFDENISTCFYGRKIDLIDKGLEDGDYENYLEIFKRAIDDKNVSLTYKKSTGIEFINDKNKVQIELDKISLFVDTNSIVMTKDRIDIGDKGVEANIRGDKGVEELHDIIKHQANTITEMMKLFQVIVAACVTPFTAPIGAALTANIPVSQSKLVIENQKVDAKADTIQSKKTFIE
jgi:hypothetical protein